MFNTEPVERIGEFKKGIDKNESRRKRQEVTLNNRRNRRFENLRKKRHVVENEPVDLNGISNNDLPVIMRNICGGDERLWQESTMILKKLLSQENNPPIEEVVRHTEVVVRLVEFLGHRNADLVMESAWALTNIASGTSEDTMTVVQCGGIPAFVNLVSHSNEKIREQAIWALGNISGESMECRDQILAYNGMQYIVPNLETNVVTIKRNTMWTISNLVRGKKKPEWSKVVVAIPSMCRVLETTNDYETLVDCLWALSYITEGKDYQIQTVLDEIDLKRLFAVASKTDNTFRTPGLRTMGNIISGSDSQTKQICEAGAVAVIADILTTTTKDNVKKECIWILSNAAAGSHTVVQDIIDSGVMSSIFYQLRNGVSVIKREALWAICNMSSTGTTMHVNWLVQNGAVRMICEMLNCNDIKILECGLATLRFILDAGEQYGKIINQANPYVEEIEKAQGVDEIEALQDHENDKIYEMASELIRDFFTEDDFEEPQNDLVWGSFSTGQTNQNQSAGANLAFNF